MPDTVLFPSDPLDERVVDPEFAREREALRWADVTLALVDHDALVNNGEVWLRKLPSEGRVLYRGWMFTVEQYRLLDEALQARGLQMITGYLDYWYAHHLPMWLEMFEAITPKTQLLSSVDLPDEVIRMTGANLLHADRFVVKDYVKSRKSEWDTAVYAPTPEALPGIVHEFVRLQGEYLVGGVVVREFIDLDKTRPEFRIWWARSGAYRAVGLHPDYDPDRYDTNFPDPFWLHDVLAPLVQKFGKPFIVTDIAFKLDGTPILIEVGDGQVSGFPAKVDDEVYEALITEVFQG